MYSALRKDRLHLDSNRYPRCTTFTFGSLKCIPPNLIALTICDVERSDYNISVTTACDIISIQCTAMQHSLVCVVRPNFCHIWLNSFTSIDFFALTAIFSIILRE
uniref:Uncharacterized protein n=1 Tax=Glossina brevipalpis TaxID=37001 RepID=A0A1A9WUN1_9MUSC